MALETDVPIEPNSAQTASNGSSGSSWFSGQGAYGGLSISGFAAGLYGSRRQNRDARRERDLAREYDQYMSNTSMQRRVADLKAAGLNPMLAMGSVGAANYQAPSAAAVVDEVGAGLRGASTAAQSSMTSAQMANLQASTRKTNAEAAILEPQAPFSSQNASMQSESLVAARNKIQKEVQLLAGQQQVQDFQINDMQPLMKQYQEYLNKSAQLGIPEKQAEAKFFSSFDDSKAADFWMKALQLFRNLAK